MDWRSFGAKHTIENVGTLLLHQGTPFGSELRRSDLESWGVNPATAAAWGWIIIEGYILEVNDINLDHNIGIYWENRRGKSMQERWELYQSILETADFVLIYEAFDKTRPAELQVENGVDPDEKKSDTSEPQASTPKAKKPVTES